MKSIFALAAVVGALACMSAKAASLHVSFGEFSRIYAFYLEGGAHNGQFNRVVLRANTFEEFTNRDSGLQGGIPRPSEQPFSYYNRMLDLGPTDPVTPGGLGWNIFNLTNTASELSFTGGFFFLTGEMISTANQPNGQLFLANVYMPLGDGTVRVQLFNDNRPMGNELVAELGGFFGPEPASFGMSGMAMLGLAALRRGARRVHAVGMRA